MNKKIYVAGHKGMVGSAIVRKLQDKGLYNIVTRTRSELDLMDQKAVFSFFEQEKPDIVFLAAAKVGGIHSNNIYPADFIYDNIMIQSNVIRAAYQSKVEKLVFLGSSCIYPKLSPQPIKEDYLLSGYLEPTNEAYAVAKIAGIKMCQAFNNQYGTNFISLMPTNLYGQNDNYDLKTSHVFPALIRKIHEAKESGASSIQVWGTGRPMREFLYVDDLADASLFLMENYGDSEIVNVGTGEDISIRDLAELMKKVIGYDGDLVFDPSMPDGTPRKLLDVSKINNLGWKAKISVEEGIKLTYKHFLAISK
jgi:GDP-L-fucose synthase